MQKPMNKINFLKIGTDEEELFYLQELSII